MSKDGTRIGSLKQVLELKKDRAELVEALESCLEKGNKWHPCDPVVTNARALLARIKGEA